MHQALSSKHLLNFLCHQYSFPWLFYLFIWKINFLKNVIGCSYCSDWYFNSILHFIVIIIIINNWTACCEHMHSMFWIQWIIICYNFGLSIYLSAIFLLKMSLSPLISLKFVSYLDTFGFFFQEVKYKTCKICMHLLTAKIWYTHSWMLHSLLLT